MKWYCWFSSLLIVVALSLGSCGTSLGTSDGAIVANTSESSTMNTAAPTTKAPKPYEVTIPNPSIWTNDFSDLNYNIKGIEGMKTIGLITGDGSDNKTRKRFRVGGTDLGIPVVHNENLYLWFGDTFWGTNDGKPMEGGLWRSNVLAISIDMDFSDGITIDDMVGKQRNSYKEASELLESQKVPGLEHTVIPTGSISINGKLYAYFMSVKEWGEPGEWTINYGGLAVSEDDGNTFVKINNFTQEPGKFGQFSAKIVGEYVYGIGVGGGRFGDAYLSRVKSEDVEDLSKYEYYIGVSDGIPEFSSDVEQSIKIIDKPVGEPSFMFNEYLQEWIVTYLNEDERAIVMRVAKNLWGPYSDELVLAHASDFTSLYGGFVDEVMTEENGKVFYFTMSMWDPVYNVVLMQTTLK